MLAYARPLFGDFTSSLAVLFGLGLAGLAAVLVLWQVFAAGPRYRRGLKRAQRSLEQGAWPGALDRIRKLRSRGSLSEPWRKRFDDVEAQCLQAAAAASLSEKKYEEALGHLSLAAQLRGQPDVEARLKVQAVMLDEVRRGFALQPAVDSLSSPTGGHERSQAIHDLIGRILQIQSPCREASFWQGLSFLREHHSQRAMEALQAARTGDQTPFLDPPLYLGAILLSQGKAKEALRYLTEANRIEPNCPVVAVQLGAAIVAAGGDTQLAVRALQRGLGSKGLLSSKGQVGWAGAFPEGHSYVHKLARAHPFICPLWGHDFTPLVRQGWLALAQAQYKLGNLQEAADLHGKAIREGAPSLLVIRGLGLALARLGQYDEAFKHLRIAHDLEEPKDRLTTGYLALCGARGTPSRPEEKSRNIAWAIAQVTPFTAPGDQEWTALINALFAEARDANISLSLDDQLYLCEHLWSVHQTDLPAAQAFHQLMAEYPQAVRPEYAWLYCRAAQQHEHVGEQTLALFAVAFNTREQAEQFFAQRQWDFGETEFTYLKRAANLAPGRFPEALGLDYPARGESMLLEQASAEERAGRLAAALAIVDVLVKLAPDNARVLDRLAALQYRQGQIEEALATLECWRRAHPNDPLPVVRAAVIMHHAGRFEWRRTALNEAMALAHGRVRANIAFLGALLSLQTSTNPARNPLDSESLAAAQPFLEECLRDDPEHAEAQWLLAAVRWLRGDESALVNQRAAFNEDAVRDPRFHFMAALVRWLSGDFAGAIESAARSADYASSNSSPSEVQIDWACENAFLVGLAQLALESPDAAAQALEKTARSQQSPSAKYAQALLGRLRFTQGQFEEATRWWQELDAKTRAEWKLGEPLAGATFVSALESFRAGRFDEAAERFRAAGRLGFRDRRLGSLLVLSLFKAGQQAVYGSA